MSGKKPEKTIRAGAVSAAVFANEVDTDEGSRILRNVVMHKNYQAGGEWRHTHTLNANDVLCAIAVLQEAHKFIDQQTALECLDEENAWYDLGI